MDWLTLLTGLALGIVAVLALVALGVLMALSLLRDELLSDDDTDLAAVLGSEPPLAN